jgi:2-oxoglutarate ferredoxin oxidoreductase subunit gamma
MLGAVIALTGLVKPESILRVLETRIPPSFLEMNRKALDLGIKIVQDLNGSKNA